MKKRETIYFSDEEIKTFDYMKIEKKGLKTLIKIGLIVLLKAKEKEENSH